MLVKFLDVVSSRVTVEIAQDNSISLKASANVLFDSTGDEDSERDSRVFLEECKHVVDELLYASPIFALIEAVDDDDERPFSEGRFESIPFHDYLERFANQTLQLSCQGDAIIY
ncbi:hypothetical protein H1R20_g15716, partial [Candolleomyces eurysporus]